MVKLDKESILRAYLDGVPVGVLAKKFGVSRERIYQLLRSEPLWSVWQKVHFCARHRDVVLLFLQGKTIAEIAKIKGVSYQTIYDLARVLVKNMCLPEEVLGKYSLKKVHKRIVQYLRQGLTVSEIARKLNKSYKATWMAIWRMKRHGVLDKMLAEEEDV